MKFRNWPAALFVLLAFLAGIPALAANAPTYKDSQGFAHDAQGVLLVNPDGSYPVGPNQLATYVVSLPGQAWYATPTDVVCLKASASKTTKIMQFTLRNQSTSASYVAYSWIRRSTLDTGGSPTHPTAVKHATADGAATAAVDVYTSAPTLGTSVGNITTTMIGTTTLTAQPTLGSIYQQTLLGDLSKQYEPVTLAAGSTEAVCINFPGTALPSGYLGNLDLVWTEE